MPLQKARRFAGAIPDGSLELVGGASHHLGLEAPSVFAARIIELTQGDGSGGFTCTASSRTPTSPVANALASGPLERL